MVSIGAYKQRLPEAGQALPGRDVPQAFDDRHHVHGRSLITTPPGHEIAIFGLGCFWGAERLFWKIDGVWTTSVGYAGGMTPNPSYREVCSGETGHAEVVRVVFDPGTVSYEKLLQVFLEAHDPTQGMRQGNDVGSQYRSIVIATTAAQAVQARAVLSSYSQTLVEAGRGPVTTELVGPEPLPDYYFADDDHQQYLSKNPAGYCGLRGTGVACAIG